MLLIDFTEHGTTINVDTYYETLLKLRQVIKTKDLENFENDDDLEMECCSSGNKLIPEWLPVEVR